MELKEYILIKKTDIDFGKIPNFTNSELHTIEEYIEFTRHLLEINQLFKIFRVNLNDILLHYELYANDFFKRKINFNDKESDYIVINALTINYISSAKTLTESIENFIESKLGEDKLEDFKTSCLSKIYDERFSYRLLIRLRDYAQHGHLPVSLSTDKRCSFNLEKIIDTPHFSHNKKLQGEIIRIKEKVFDEFEDTARITFTRSIAEFEISILEIYMNFINIIREKLFELLNNFNNLIKEKPEIIHKSTNYLNGLILYPIDNENINGINPEGKPIEMIDDIKKELQKDLIKAKKEFEKIFESEE